MIGTVVLQRGSGSDMTTVVVLTLLILAFNVAWTVLNSRTSRELTRLRKLLERKHEALKARELEADRLFEAREDNLRVKLRLALEEIDVRVVRDVTES